jgi:hypothetical protein
MSWSNKDMDQLFRNADSQQQFVYDTKYFEDIERQLPVKRSRRSIFWWLSSFMMFGVFSLLFFTRFYDDVIPLSARSATKMIAYSESKDQSVRDQENNFAVEKGKQLEEAEYYSISQEISTNIESGTFSSQQSHSFEKAEIDLLEQAPLVPFTFNELNYAIENGNMPNLINYKSKSSASWFLSLNGGMQQGWTSESKGLGLNGVVSVSSGVDVEWGNWVFGAGVSFAWHELNQLEIRERTKIYGLGYSTYDNSYSFTGVGTVSLPLTIAYKMGRHQLGVGLESGRNTFASMRRVQSMDGEVFHMTQGITDVSLLNKFSLQPGVNYAYELNEQVSVGINVNYQLLRPLSSDRFEGEQNFHPWSVGISLKAKLIQ